MIIIFNGARKQIACKNSPFARHVPADSQIDDSCQEDRAVAKSDH